MIYCYSMCYLQENFCYLLYMCIGPAVSKQATESDSGQIQYRLITWHLNDVYCFSIHLNVMWTVFIDGSVKRYGPCPSPLLAGDLHYACAYIQSVLLLFVCVCLVNGCLNRCGSHISPLISSAFRKKNNTYAHPHTQQSCVQGIIS